MNAAKVITPKSSMRKTTSRRQYNLVLSIVCALHISDAKRYTANARGSQPALFVPPAHNPLSSYKYDYKTSNLHVLERRAPGLPFPSPFLQNNNGNKNYRNDLNPNSKIKNINNSYTEFTKDHVLIGIEKTSPNSRRISGEMLMDISIADIWSILTDYDNLSTHVPNLVESRIIDPVRNRVYQRGAQQIFGFEFGADVTMDMTERVDQKQPKKLAIDFKCVDSQFFSQFDGSWIVEEYTNDLSMASSGLETSTSNTITMVQYIVDVRPKGPVPVAALEWRIKEDVPTNVLAVSKAARSKMVRTERQQQQQLKYTQQDNQEAQQQPDPVVVLPTQQQPQPQPQQRQRRKGPLQRLRPPAPPFQQFANQATSIIKQTAKAYLPDPATNAARQALNIVTTAANYAGRGVLMGPRNVGASRRTKTSVDTGAGDFLNGGQVKGVGNDVEWYEDETMAMYLKKK